MKTYSMQAYGTVVVKAEDKYEALRKFGDVCGCIEEVSDYFNDVEIRRFDYNYTTLQEE